MKLMKMKNVLASMLLLLLFVAQSFCVHPYHVGSVEFFYNGDSQTFEISGKFFMDDFENSLKRKFGKNLRFQDPKMEKELNEAIKNYAQDYLKIKVNNKLLKVNYVGFEEDKESVNVYLETETVSAPKKVETSVSFLYNYFDDQMNIVHIIVGGKRQSEKLSYPNRYLYKNF